MSFTVKKLGSYAPTVAITEKKGGIYAAIAGIFAKVGGAYQRVDVVPLVTNPYNQYTVEVQSATTGGACRVAMMSSKRATLVLQNPAGNSQSFEYAQTSNPNNNRNTPTSGYVSIAPGQQVTFTGVDAVKQLYVKTLTANNKAITALSSSGLVASATIPAHGLNTGDVRAFEGNVPGGYNIRNVAVTVIDGDNIQFPLAATTAAATTLGYMYRADEVVNVITGETT